MYLFTFVELNRVEYKNRRGVQENHERKKNMPYIVTFNWKIFTNGNGVCMCGKLYLSTSPTDMIGYY